MSAYKIYIPKDQVVLISTQVTFDESIFPMKEALLKKTHVILNEQDLSDTPWDMFPFDESEYFIPFNLNILSDGFVNKGYEYTRKFFICSLNDMPMCNMHVSKSQMSDLMLSMGTRVGNSHVTSHLKCTISAFSAILQDCVAARYSPIQI